MKYCQENESIKKWNDEWIQYIRKEHSFRPELSYWDERAVKYRKKDKYGPYEEKKKMFTLSEEDVERAIRGIMKSASNSNKFRRTLIDTLIYKIYLYDDHYKILFRISDKEKDLAYGDDIIDVEGSCIEPLMVY